MFFLLKSNLTKKILTGLWLVVFSTIFLSANQLAANAYDFKAESGLSTTGREAGYDEKMTAQPEKIAGQVIQAILGLLGIIFLGLMIYAGLIWMTAQGNEQKTALAKKIIEGAAVGLVIVIMAYAISYFIINYFQATVKTR